MTEKMDKKNMSLEAQHDPTETPKAPVVKCDYTVGKSPETKDIGVDSCAKVGKC